MSDKPIVVSTKPLQLSGTVRGPIVVTPQEGDSGDTTPRLGYNQITYKVKLVANGKTFNMLLPPSIESKHPGRSNPLQLPGLQIKANINISKLKIPGFFPIYQNLGVESLTVSMSGMFTGYDGTNLLSAANWENSVGIGQSNVEQGQDSFTSASELYEFAVNNKALVQVTIYTSDGSFIPKKSTSTAFRDNNSNISFKGYIKEFEQVYIRQDRNYYLLRFEIVDFGSAKCKAVVKSDKTNNTLLNNITSSAYGINDPSITAEDIAYLSPEDLERAKTLIDKINKGEKITNKDLDGITISTMAQIAIYANSKGQNTDDLYAYILNKTPTAITEKEYLANPEREKYLANKFETNITLICNYLKNDCKSQKEVITKNKEVINKGINNSSNNSNSKTPKPITPSLPPELKTQAQIIISSNMYNKRFTDKYITTTTGIFVSTRDANIDFKISPIFEKTIFIRYIGNKNIDNKYYPILNILGEGNYIAIPIPNNSRSVKLERF